MFNSQVRPEIRVIAAQPMSLHAKKAFRDDMLSLPIINAHEFAPHVKLDVLGAFDTLLVHEDVSYVEAMTGFEQSNKYKVVTKNGSQLYQVKEESSFMARCCIGSNRPFSLAITDSSGEEIIHLTRPYRCGCICCCLQELSVYSPPGNLIGYITEHCNVFKPTYHLYDATLPDSPLFEVKGSDPGAKQIGCISKKWGGLMRELLTDSDTFGVSFPLDTEPKYKALFLAACFLIDFKHFERSVVNG